MLTDVWGLEATENNEPITILPSGDDIYWDKDVKKWGRVPVMGEAVAVAEVPWYYKIINGMNSVLDEYFYTAQDMYNNPGKIAEAVKSIPIMVAELLPRCEIVNSPEDMSGGESIIPAIKNLVEMDAGDWATSIGEAIGEGIVKFPLIMGTWGAYGATNAVKQIAEEAVQKGADVAKQALDNTNYIGYKSFYRFKKAYGTAGKGYAWHHIVEKHQSNISKFGAEAIHNINNLIKLPHGKGSIHEKISAHYSSIQDFTNGKTVRQWLSSQSYQEQYDYGIKMLKQYGWTP